MDGQFRTSLPTFNWNDPLSAAEGFTGFGAEIFPISKEKTAPESLEEYINHSSIPAGATILILGADDASEIKFITNLFLLTNLQMTFREKAQIQETLGSTNVSFFGESARVYQFSGRAVDWPDATIPSLGMNQSALTQLYNNQMRATKLVKEGNIAVMKIFNHVIYGYPLNFSVNYNSSNDKVTAFNMSWVVARHTQNLPGLFSTQDLENTYSTGSTILSGENAARLKSIQDFLDAYETNLIIKIENQRFSESIQAPTISFDVGSQILNYSNLSTIDLNSLISSFYQGDTSSQTTLKDKIIEGTKTFANYIEGQKNKRTGNSFILNKFGKELLDDVRNGSADNMFKTDEALNRTLQFLSLVYKVRTAFQNIKQQLLISG